MAIPRVFISSTYYDLRHVRNDIGNFIISLGYESVMHDKGNVPYTQTEPLELSCYNELSTCDIVVCIIGNKYGTQSAETDYSITMKELLTAIKAKKMVYIFIAKDVYTENRTYSANKDLGNFIPVYADSIKIHEFISDIKSNIRNHPICPFDTVEDINNMLKEQLAGLFQNLLRKESSVTESNTYYDLQASANSIRDLITKFENEKEEFFIKFESSIFATNFTLKTLRNKIGMKKAVFFAKDLDALDEIMELMGFKVQELFIISGAQIYEKICGNKKITVTLDGELFEEDGRLKDIRKSAIVDEHLKWEEYEIEEDELPF